MEKIITDEMIRESYGEIIEGLLLNRDYVNEKYAISLIRTVLECGVNAFDLDKIEYICMKVIDIKNLKNERSGIGYNSFDFASNKAIAEEAIRLYDEKQEPALDDVNDEMLDTIYKVEKIRSSR